MLLQIVKRDVLRNKIITGGLFIFIMLSSLLVASASHIIMELTGSLNQLLAVSKAPHFVQMHSGTLDDSALKRFVSGNPLVQDQQTVEMLTVDGSNVYLGNPKKSEAASVMDIGFVKQNQNFDLLLNLDNQVITVSRGEIAVPIYYKGQKQLHIGDKVNVTSGSFTREFVIVDFVRDVQMNPAIVSSKRFVVNEADYTALRGNVGEVEYLIEFQLKDSSKLTEFRNSYQSAGLPDKGPTIDYPLFKTLNALTDGIIALVIILVSLLLMVIAILCLRFTMIASMEEDYREIGVMKAIGLPRQDIRRIYMAKYIILAALASCCGYGLSLFTARLFTANISLYLGAAPKGLLQYIVPLLAVSLSFGIVVLFCRLILRRFNRITAIEALRSGTAGVGRTHTSSFTLSNRKWLPVNGFLGLKDVYSRFSMFGVLLLVVVICLFMIIMPVNLLNTLRSPHFISYMGVGQSTIRIDLQQSGDTARRFEQMLTTLKKDPDIKKLSPLITSRFKVLGSDDVWENINVETGDFSIFPLSYIEGGAPEGGSAIALSDLNAKELNKRVGDTLLIKAGGKERQLTVSGIYQDITNGGRTAKAQLPYDPKTVMWYVVAVDVQPEIPVAGKIEELAGAFYPAKITYLDSYLAQTLGNTVKQLRMVTILAITISISIAVLITSLFLKMLLAKDSTQITILRSIGFTVADIRRQYLARTLLIAGLGSLLGILTAGTIGQSLVHVLGSFLGASRIQLEVDPVLAYLILPVSLMLAVAVTTIGSTGSIHKSGFTNKIAD